MKAKCAFYLLKYSNETEHTVSGTSACFFILSLQISRKLAKNYQYGRIYYHIDSLSSTK